MAAVMVLPAAGAAGPEGSAEETNAFYSASKLFTDGQYSLAETNFSKFLETYTNSTHRAYAVLYLARSRLEQSNGASAITLLQKAFPDAGDMGPEYVFWIARSRLSVGDYTNAATGFANVAKMPASSRRLQAAYDQALTYSEITNWPQIIRILEPTNGVFHVMAAYEPKNPFGALGTLLLGEAYLETHRYAEADKTVRALDPAVLETNVAWRRQYLLCKVGLAAGQGEQALTETTNLLTLATGPAHKAASEFLQGQILESLGRTNDALQAYAANLADGLPVHEQWRAMIKTVRLTVAINSLQASVDALTNLIARLPRAPGLDLARVTLGELYLKEFAAPGDGADATNAAPRMANPLENALTNFSIVIQDFTNSPWLAKARLDRGWCYWARENIAAARSDFEVAARDLPHSDDQAVAFFKLGDADFAARDYAGALSNYNQVLRLYDNEPNVTNELFAPALYQSVEADINLGDDKAAQAAVEKILLWFPDNYLGSRGSLLRGERLLLLGEKVSSRQAFIDLLKRSPDSPLAAEAEYDIARTYDDEGDWQAAIRRYDGWVKNHPGDPLLPEVEYYRALANAKAGMAANALIQFTNFVARYPSNSLAPWAKVWVADYYFNQQAYPLAELNYQELSRNFPQAGDLAFKALFWAGRTALANQEIMDARDYFSQLINNTNTPAPLAAQAFLALGDVAFQQFQANPTNETFLSDAINAVANAKVTNGAPANAIAVEAIGRLGDYYMHYADLKSDTNVYAKAGQMYAAILSYPATDVSVAARSQAEVGLGLIAEREHLPKRALAHYARVLYEYDPNRFDPYWVETAGEYAARICESEQKWDQAIAAYRRVLEAVPSLKPVLDKRINTALGRAEAARN
jgi:TolA-binding protein